jgi:hypothetical protein
VGSGPFDTQAQYDYDGDGTPDLVVANRNNNTVSIYLGNGDGTFQPNPVGTYPVGKEPAAVFTSNFRKGSYVFDIAVILLSRTSVTAR